MSAELSVSDALLTPVPLVDVPKDAGTQGFATLSAHVSERLGEAPANLLGSAWEMACAAHAGQWRRSGEPYITHPLAVAGIVNDMNMDIDSLLAALLHDVIEDTEVTKEDIAARLGVVVAELVDGVSRLDRIHGVADRATEAAENHAAPARAPKLGKGVRVEAKDNAAPARAPERFDNIHKMALAMSRDLRVIVIKLADRLHNMRTIAALDSEATRRIALETMEIYAPIAMRLGMQGVCEELEGLSFEALHPMRARRIAVAVKKAAGHRSELTEQIRAQIEWHLVHKRGFRAKVLGRQKSVYSIYRKMQTKMRTKMQTKMRTKMQTKRTSFKEIMDVYGFRVVVDDVDTCYRALGAIHGLYCPRPGHFKDYIAMPKANGYQSLHTVLFGMYGVLVEIQIRTPTMNHAAQHGIAAHWAYKEGDDAVSAVEHRQRVLNWVNGLLELQRRTGGDAREFIEHLKADLFPDEIYVFTPRGEVVELPVNATALDFAYAVHTDIGNQCKDCTVNGRPAPLSQTLESGDTVLVSTDESASPQLDWLDFLATAKARVAALHVLNQRRREDILALGQALLDQECQHAHQCRLAEVGETRRQAFVTALGKASFEDCLADIGNGRYPVRLAAWRLMDAEFVAGPPIWRSWLKRINLAKREPLVIDGSEGMSLTFSKCCRPIPGDDIVGHLTSNRGLSVHVIGCRAWKREKGQADAIPLRWSEKLSAHADGFETEVRVEIETDRGAMTMLANCATRLDAVIEELQQIDQSQRLCLVVMRMRVRDRVHLARVIRGMREIKAVNKVRRSRA